MRKVVLCLYPHPMSRPFFAPAAEKPSRQRIFTGRGFERMAGRGSVRFVPKVVGRGIRKGRLVESGWSEL
jgi:hypothetical protein